MYFPGALSPHLYGFLGGQGKYRGCRTSSEDQNSVCECVSVYVCVCVSVRVWIERNFIYTHVRISDYGLKSNAINKL